jgi:hypothetical protein
MKKNYFIGLLLIAVALIAVSCSADKAVQDELVNVSFTKLQAKGISSDYFTVNKNAEISNAQVQVGDVTDYFWSYKATKKDSGFTSGQTTEFTAWTTDKGLSGSKEFSKGDWIFEFKAYATDEARTAASSPIFSGTAGTSDTPISLADATQTVAVTMAHAGTTGNATADITVTAKLTQDTSNYSGTASSITKIEILIGEKTIELQKATNPESNGSYKWTKTDSEVTANSAGTKITMKVYLDSESEPTVTKELDSVVFLYGLTTKIEGTATITATAKDEKVSASINATMPTYQSQSTIVSASTL